MLEIENYDLGVKILTPKKNIDERGFVSEILRSDWQEFFDGKFPQQINISKSFPGVIRAWHRHKRNQIDYFIVQQGSMKICAYVGDKESPDFGKLVEIKTVEEKLQIIKIPGHLWHGTKTISDKPSITVYFLTNLYDYSSPDEERLDWNDLSIIDPKTKNPYDWNLS